MTAMKLSKTEKWRLESLRERVDRYCTSGDKFRMPFGEWSALDAKFMLRIVDKLLANLKKTAGK